MKFLEKFSYYFSILTIILAPFYVFRGEVLFLNIYLPTTLLEILWFFSFVSTALLFLIQGAEFKKIKTKFDVLILIFLIAGVFSVFRSHDILGGLGILRAYFIEPILFYFVLIYQARKHGYSFILTALITSGIILTGLGIWQKLTGSLTLAPNEIIQGRISGPYNSANSFALYLSPIAILVLAKALKLKKRNKILMLVLFGLMVAVLTWTRSRGGMIALWFAVFIFYYSYFATRIKKLQKFWYFIPVIALLFCSIFFFHLYQKYNYIPHDWPLVHTKGDTLQIRYFIWAGTVNLIKDNPILGAGLNGFKELYAQKYKVLISQEEVQYPHNLLLTFWTETGILGLSTFLLLLVSQFSLLMRNLNRNQLLGAGLIGVLSYSLIHGIVDVPFFKNDLSLEFFVILALTQGFFETKEYI